MTRLSAAWQAIQSLRRQALLLLDLAANTLVLGLLAVCTALWTGQELRPAIDWMFSWQASSPEVNAAAGFEVTSHTERAFWKKKLRMYLPKEYQQ